MTTIDSSILDTITGGLGLADLQQGASQLGARAGEAVGNWYRRNSSKITDAVKTIYAPPPTFPNILGNDTSRR